MTLLRLLILAALYCGFLWTAKQQSQPQVVRPIAHTAVAVDDAIDASDVPHYTFKGTQVCLTPESSVCATTTEPQIEVQ